MHSSFIRATHRSLLPSLVLLGATTLGARTLRAQDGAHAAPFTIPLWAFPTSPAAHPAPVPDSVVPRHVPNATRTFTMAEVQNGYNIPDWFPESHPSMPTPVQYGRKPNGRACAYCHLANGSGRPENGTLAGLPAEYIRKQVASFRDGTRLTANPAANTNSMHVVAKAVTDSDVAIAADYFAKLKLTRRNRVIESARAPKTRIEVMLFALDGAGTEPIDGRLIEVPESFERHELRDPTVLYTTYVAPGTIEHGRRLVAKGPAGPATACAKCHGPALLGVGPVPPIAGRSPSNILRQLMNFRAGARHEEGSATMAPVVEKLTVGDMVALAAYVGSRRPY